MYSRLFLLVALVKMMGRLGFRVWLVISCYDGP